jgi:hypothetical protein
MPVNGVGPLPGVLQLTVAAQRHADATAMSPKYKSFRIKFKPARPIFSDFPPSFARFANLGQPTAPFEF